MKVSYIEALAQWPKNFITGTDLFVVLDKSYDSRHAIIKRLVQATLLVKIKNDLYLIKGTLRKTLPDSFELAQMIWGPSYISFESALSFHGWIPEAVYTTTSACSKNGKVISTPIGVFSYNHVPAEAFAMGIYHHQNSDPEATTFLIAEPWKAIADYIYSHKKVWPTLQDLTQDLRIEKEKLYASDLDLLKYLSEQYPSPRTQKALEQFYKEIMKK